MALPQIDLNDEKALEAEFAARKLDRTVDDSLYDDLRKELLDLLERHEENSSVEDSKKLKKLIEKEWDVTLDKTTGKLRPIDELTDDEKNEIFYRETEDPFEIITPQLGRQFRNYCGNIVRNPPQTFSVSNLQECRSAVQQSISEKRGVRAKGEGHSWSDIFVDNYAQNFVNTQALSDTSTIVKKMVEDPRPGAEGKETEVLVIPAGVSCGAMSKWFKENNASIPLDVILQSVRYGGTIATGSHGGGWDTQTLPDLVFEMEVITYETDDNGEDIAIVKTLPYEDMATLAISLGTTGLIHTITLFVNPMYNVLVTNTLIKTEDLLPRDGNDFSKLLEFAKGTDPERPNEYVEVFHFPWIEELHVMTFQKAIASDGPVDKSKISAAPDALTYISSILGNWFLNSVISGPLKECFWAHWLMSKLQMTQVPKGQYVIPIPNALHWRAYITKIKTWDVEMAMPVQLPNEEIDFRPFRDCFYDTLDAIAEARKKDQYPVDVTVEFRLTAGSDCLLSAAYGNEHTAWLEFLSAATNEIFEDFAVERFQKWYKISPQARPHWGKWNPEQIAPEAFNGETKKRYADGLAAMADRIRELELDPKGYFLNTHLAGLLGTKKSAVPGGHEIVTLFEIESSPKPRAGKFHTSSDNFDLKNPRAGEKLVLAWKFLVEGVDNPGMVSFSVYKEKKLAIDPIVFPNVGNSNSEQPANSMDNYENLYIGDPEGCAVPFKVKVQAILQDRTRMAVVHADKVPLPDHKHRCSQNFSLAMFYPVGSNSLMWEVSNCENKDEVVFNVDKDIVAWPDRDVMSNLRSGSSTKLVGEPHWNWRGYYVADVKNAKDDFDVTVWAMPQAAGPSKIVG